MVLCLTIVQGTLKLFDDSNGECKKNEGEVEVKCSYV